MVTFLATKLLPIKYGNYIFLIQEDDLDIFKVLNEVLDYVEDHLLEDIDMQALANIAMCSEHHFRRMFPYLTGISLNEYVRNRRLSVAAMEITFSKTPVSDLCLKYGYDSRVSFSRAFKKLHGYAPSQVRNETVDLVLYPKLIFKAIINGGECMKYRIENQEAFKLFGVPRHIKKDENKHQVLPKYAEEVMENGSHTATMRVAGQDSIYLHGIHYYCENESYYMFGWEYENHFILEEKMEILDVKKGQWAIFTGAISYDNQELFHQTWQQIYSEWFPSSNYEEDKRPCIEKFTKDMFEIWIPIKEK